MSKVSIIIGTHGQFGEELVRSAEMIVGKMENVQCFSLLPELSFEDYMRNIDSSLAQVNTPMIVLVDLYGGTPCNVFTVLSRKYHYNVITGVNLPTLIELYLNTSNSDEVDLEQATELCIQTIKDSALCTNKQLTENQE